MHAVPTPRLGGVAMLAGLAVAMAVASQIPFLDGVFQDTRRAWGIVGAAAMVCLLGMADDIWDLDWITKLAGQCSPGVFLACQGVQLYQLPFGGGLLVGSSRLSLFVTVLAVVVAMNAVNFVDGLDGLAAGHDRDRRRPGSSSTPTCWRARRAPPTYSNLATVVIAALVGACIGFLPHNFYPARIFMGDSGSMLIGLVIAAAAIVVTGQIDTGVVTDRQIDPGLPADPAADRRAAAAAARHGPGRGPPGRRRHARRSTPTACTCTTGCCELGHSHRRAVVIMYLWTAVFAFGAAALVLLSTTTVLVVLGVAAVVAALLTLGPLRGRSRPADLHEGTRP